MKKFLYPLSIICMVLGLSSCNIVEPVEITKISQVVLNVDNPAEASVSAMLELHNPNNFELLIKEADIDVYIQDIYLGKLQIPETMHLQKKQKVSTRFMVSIKTSSLLAIGMNVVSRMKTGYFDLELKGTFYSEFLWFKRNIKIDRKEKVQLK